MVIQTLTRICAGIFSLRVLTPLASPEPLDVFIFQSPEEDL